jgi:hypothetical protein
MTDRCFLPLAVVAGRSKLSYSRGLMPHDVLVLFCLLWSTVC